MTTSAFLSLAAMTAATLSSPALSAAQSEFAGWDSFTCPDATCTPNAPDISGTSNLDARVAQLIPGAVITSSHNIYHPSAASHFLLTDTAPAEIGSINLFLRVDGSPLDTGSVVLRFGSEARNPIVSGGAGLWTFDWDLNADAVTTYTIEWDATAAHMSLDRIELTLGLDDTLGQRECTALPNSTGLAAEIYANGSAQLVDDQLNFRAINVPNQPGIFFSGLNSTQIPFGNGFLCTSGTILRGKVVVGSGFQVSYHWPTTSLLPGTRHFQYWFRDPASGGAGYNTSDSLAIALQ